MSGNGDEYWQRIAAETHAKLIDAREQLARMNSAEYRRHSSIREDLFTALVDLRAEGSKKARTPAEIRADAAISRAGGGG